MSSIAPRKFTDVAEGDIFSMDKPPMTTMQLVMYAGASGDFNRIHYDHHFAVEAGLGGVITHGMLTMGCLAQAVTNWAGPGAVVKDIRSRFVSPVKPGDVVKFDGWVKSTDPAGGRRQCALEVDGFVGDRQVISGSAVVELAAD